jgi:hypothetical protein
MTDSIPIGEPQSAIRDLVDDLKSLLASVTTGFGFNLRTLANLFTFVAVLCVLYGVATVTLGVIRGYEFWYYDLGLYFIAAGVPTSMAGRRIRRDNA